MWSWIHNSSAYNTDREIKHIYLGSERLVTRTNGAGTQGNMYTAQVSTYYYHSDHLGSAQLITDNEGKEYERIEYTPYGEYWIEKRAPENKTLPFKFTGKERDEETGLYYYGARYLDPRTSRWLSADPALGEYMAGSKAGVGGIYNQVNFNLYHYGNNNPVKYSDPDGKSVLGKVLGYGCYIAAGAVLLAGTAVVATTAGTTAVVVAPAAVTLAGKLTVVGTAILATDVVTEKIGENLAKSKGNKEPEAKPADKPSLMPEDGAESSKPENKSPEG